MELKHKLLSLLLTISILATPLTAYAETEWDPNAGQGTDVDNVGDGTFDMGYQGFRVTLFDGAELMYSENNCVDILFSTPPSKDGNVIGLKNKLGNAEAKRNTISIRDDPNISDMPLPIEWDSKTRSFIANGKAVRSYLMDGDPGSSGNPFKPNLPSNPNPPTTPPPLSQSDMDKCFDTAKIYEDKIRDYTLKELNQISSLKSWFYKTGKPSTSKATLPVDVNKKIQTILDSAKRELKYRVTVSQYEFIIMVIEQTAYFQQIQYEYDYKNYIEIISEQQGSLINEKENVRYTLQNDISNIRYAETSEVTSENTTENKVAKMTPFLQACFAEYHENIISDISTASNPIMMIEPIIWYRPVALSGAITNYFVYGTAGNIAEYSIKFAGDLGNENGANMSTLTHAALPNSMTVETRNETLNVSPVDGESKYYTSRQLLGLK